ncbi:MAG: HAMP domain-containing histidine kinase [Candidatus Marinimicrobia bacterium]|nr:HAMP domain-containing histidine kinase [FCB group bacterium]MBL7024473.1 HAMP domain-containing histidine kinase [Candidatus Neomarinimicrobiota bacterium]
MRRFFQSFYGKLTSVFLLVLIFMGISQVVITTRSFISFNQEVDQRLNLNLAKDMAFELIPILDEELDFGKIGERIHYMMVMNPKIEIYVLNEWGNVLAFFAEPGKTMVADSVDLDPVYQFLLQADHAPILGSDPRQPGKRKPFSAAELLMGDGSKGFLYIIIGGQQYDSTFAFFQESYIVRTMINGLLITVVFAGIIGLILFALLTKRLRVISEIVSEFEQGNLEHRIDVSTKDEFGQLGHSFNSMADTIEATIEKLRLNDNLRRELIANVSHDLRTPLASIQGYVETILMKTDMDDEKKLKYLGVILKNTQSLSNQVNELFELSKLEAKQILPVQEPFSINELAQDVCLKFKTQIEDHGLELVDNIPHSLPPVIGDIAMVERVISNLIRNASEFTESGGRISLDIKQQDKSVMISIEDTGQGISPDDLPRIFDRFYTGGKKSIKGSTSTGLGLTIASKMIEAHDQVLEVESELGRGTCFYFSLPIA